MNWTPPRLTYHTIEQQPGGFLQAYVRMFQIPSRSTPPTLLVGRRTSVLYAARYAGDPGLIGANAFHIEITIGR